MFRVEFHSFTEIHCVWTVENKSKSFQLSPVYSVVKLSNFLSCRGLRALLNNALSSSAKSKDQEQLVQAGFWNPGSSRKKAQYSVSCLPRHSYLDYLNLLLGWTFSLRTHSKNYKANNIFFHLPVWLLNTACGSQLRANRVLLKTQKYIMSSKK